MADIDVVLRGGTLFDGTGAEPVAADVAISGARIIAVGRVAGRGAEEIDARGLIVTPGFVDIHTHYDAQVTFENHLAPSSGNGVTTAIMGNCGVGFAPCRPAQREMLLRLMEGVEDIPHAVLAEGLPWNWESFPEYFATLAARHFDIDIGGFLPHAPLRVYVMGERACSREPATEADREQMAATLREAVEAGAFGFATSRTMIHRSSTGEFTPTLNATEAELTALALAMKQAGRGVMELVSDWDDADAVFGEMRRIVERSGRPLTFALTQNHRNPDIWRRIMALVGEANDDGLPIKVQVLPRPLGLLLSHELTLNPFYSTPTFRSIAHLPFAVRIEALKQPDIRARIIAEEPEPDTVKGLGNRVRYFETMFEFSDPPDYEPDPSTSVAAQAARRGILPAELAYDLLLKNDGRTMLYLAISNYADKSLEPVLAMLTHKDSLPGLGDAGAHLGSICDGSYATSTLIHWGRDRRVGAKLALPDLVRRLSRDTAAFIGLDDRGIVAPGYKADLNLIDFDRLALQVPELVQDLPAGGRRLTQRARGYVATMVSGTVTHRDGVPTGALPGRLVRGPQAAPKMA